MYTVYIHNQEIHCSSTSNTFSIVKPTRRTNVLKFILFWNDTLHVSGSLSVHHQEYKTVHTATGICQTDTAVCLLAQYLFDKCLLLYVQS